MKEYKTLTTTETSENVLLVAFNRPKKLNAFTKECVKLSFLPIGLD